MIYWSIHKLVESGINDILIITNRYDLEQFKIILSEGFTSTVNLTYKIQDEAKGIAAGVSLAKEFIGSEKFVVLLSDNIFEDSLNEDL